MLFIFILKGLQQSEIIIYLYLFWIVYFGIQPLEQNQFASPI